MNKFIGKLVAYIITIPIILFVIHLFTVGGFGTSFGMIVDDARMLAACPTKPGRVLDFLLRSDAEQYSIFMKDTESLSSAAGFVNRIYNLDDEGALDAICDRVSMSKLRNDALNN